MHYGFYLSTKSSVTLNSISFYTNILSTFYLCLWVTVPDNIYNRPTCFLIQLRKKKKIHIRNWNTGHWRITLNTTSEHRQRNIHNSHAAFPPSRFRRVIEIQKWKIVSFRENTLWGWVSCRATGAEFGCVMRSYSASAKFSARSFTWIEFYCVVLKKKNRNSIVFVKFSYFMCSVLICDFPTYYWA